MYFSMSLSLLKTTQQFEDIFDFVLPQYLLLTQGTELHGLAYSVTYYYSITILLFAPF